LNNAIHRIERSSAVRASRATRFRATRHSAPSTKDPPPSPGSRLDRRFNCPLIRESIFSTFPFFDPFFGLQTPFLLRLYFRTGRDLSSVGAMSRYPQRPATRFSSQNASQRFPLHVGAVGALGALGASATCWAFDEHDNCESTSMAREICAQATCSITHNALRRLPIYTKPVSALDTSATSRELQRAR
jgi:hypothetical protein